MVSYNKLKVSSNLKIHICSCCKKLQNVLQHFPYNLYRQNQIHALNLRFLIISPQKYVNFVDFYTLHECYLSSAILQPAILFV